MKHLLIFGMFIIGGCCRDVYESVDYPAPVIQLNLDYHYTGFSPKDTVFNIYYYSYGSSYFYSDYYYAPKLNDSQRYIYFNNINFEKIIVKSINSSFTDSITNLGFNSKEVSKGSKNCGNAHTQVFNVHTIYKDKELSSGENATLIINVTK